MVKLLKLGSVIYENFEEKVLDPNGNLVLNPIIPQRLEELQKAIKDTVLWLEGKRVGKVLSSYGYTSLADVMYYAQVQSDEEAKALLNWYSNSEGNGYDDLIWDWIDNELPKYQTVEELLSIDLKQIEAQIFEKTKDLLPKEED